MNIQSMEKYIVHLERQRAEAREVIEGAWNQFAYEGKKGLHSGGLSALEYIEQWLAANPEETE